MRGKMSVWVGVALLALTNMGLSLPAYAHHSFAMFDQKKVLTLKGVLHKIEWANPHVYLYLVAEAPDGGGEKQYIIECGSPNNLSRMGWKVNTVKVGDSLTVSVYPLRDGRPGGLFDKMTLESGRVINVM